MGYGLVFTEKEVPVGMHVHLYMNGSDKPEEMDGVPMEFRCMIGGVPARTKIYHMENGRPVAGLEGFADGARFSPSQIFSPEDAPVGGEFAVYVEGERMRATPRIDGDPKFALPVRVRKKEDGRLVGSNGYIYQLWQREVALPDNAQLARVSIK